MRRPRDSDLAIAMLMCTHERLGAGCPSAMRRMPQRLWMRVFAYAAADWEKLQVRTTLLASAGQEVLQALAVTERAVVSDGGDGSVIVWSDIWRNGRVVGDLGGPSLAMRPNTSLRGICSFTVLPGGTLATATGHGAIDVWDLNDPLVPRRSRTIDGNPDEAVTALASLGDSILACGLRSTVKIYDLAAEGTDGPTITLHMRPCADLSPRDSGDGILRVEKMVACSDSRLVVYVLRDWGEIVLDVWCMRRGDLLRTISGSVGTHRQDFAPMHEDDLHALVAMPGGDVVATSGGYELSIKMWCVETAACICAVDQVAGLNPAYCLVALDEYVLASGHENGSIALLDVTTGLPICILEAHKEQVNSIITHVADPNGLISCSHDGTIKLWTTQGYLA